MYDDYFGRREMVGRGRQGATLAVALWMGTTL